MKRFALLLALALCACNPNKTILDAQFHPTDRGWGSHQPVWSDEFDGTALDTAKWVTARFCGGYNNEAQCYTDRQANITVGGGYLTITARYEAQGCEGTDIAAAPNEFGTVSCTPSTALPDYAYSSGRIHTRVTTATAASPPPPWTWRYGRVEIRAQLPYGTGTWPAFWMLPEPQAYGQWPRSGEIDIMEAVNLHSPTVAGDYVQSNIHLCSEASYYTAEPSSAGTPVCQSPPPPPPATQQISPNYQKASFPRQLYLTPTADWSPNLTTAFHTYAMEWSDLDMRFFVDDQLIGRVLHVTDPYDRAPFQQPFYLIVNLAVGGDMPMGIDRTNWLQSPGPTAQLVIDWIRVYDCFPDPTARRCIYQHDEGIGRQ